VSWLFCQNQGCNTYALDPIWNYALDSIARPGAYPPCPECKGKGTRRPVLVSPLKQKELKDAAIREIWQMAAEVLRGAGEIVFAGFSLSENDSAVRDLLKAAFNQGSTRRITVVDQNPAAIKGNYLDVYGDMVQFAVEENWKSFLDRSFGAVNGTEQVARSGS